MNREQNTSILEKYLKNMIINKEETF